MARTSPIEQNVDWGSRKSVPSMFYRSLTGRVVNNVAYNLVTGLHFPYLHVH
jgi:hypothetical protein